MNSAKDSTAKNHFKMKQPLQSPTMRLEKFWLYETKTYFYLVGFDDQESRFRLLKINRSIARPKDLSEIIMEDPLVYDAQEIADILNMINEGNRQSGGIVKICTAFGIVGFVRFLNGFYLTLITQRKEVGCIAGNFIYSIKATEMFPIRPKEEKESNTFRTLWKKLNKKLNQTTSEIAENRYMGLFQFVDMTKDFFFSYSYDLTRSLQHNYIHSTASTSSSPLEMFEWNNYQIHELREVIGSDESAQWTLPIIHGSYQQKRFSLFGRAVDLVLVARRSRHYAGTRYLKRGLNVHGKVANDCEVEQILQCDGGAEVLFTSYVQMRGSIPTYWHQETSVTMPKPPILLNRVDPDYLATQEHFADLFRRYGAPLIVLDLVKQHEKRPRESIVGREFRQAVEVLNESIPMDRKIRYIALDYSKITSISKGKLSKAKTKNSGFLGYGGKDKERAMAVVGDEWALMEKSLVKDQSSSGSVAGKSKPDISLTNLDEARKDFQSTVVPGSFSTKSGTGLPVGYDSIAEINAVESKIDVLRELEDVAHLTIFETGFFCSSLQYLERVKDCIPQTTYEKAKRDKILFQNGVLRTNCIDCLDRTNGGQFAVAMRFLLVSLQALGISSPHLLSLDLSKDPLLLSLMEMYGEMGDKIALQYGGSEAHKKVFAGKSVQTHSSSKQSELLTSIKRYYSNAFTDMVKQDAMNLFLGCFVPNESSIPLWDLESDYYLHNLDLHPKAPDVYHVLYREIIHDSESIRDVTFKSRIESAVKKSISDFARMKDSDNQTLGRTASGDSLGGEKISSNNISSNSDSSNVDSGKLGLKIEAGKLMKRYYLKNLALEKAMGKLKNKGGLTNSLIRSLARLERRKMMRILVSRKIAFASEGWWLTPLMEYLDILKMWNGQQRFTNQSGKDFLKGNSSSIDYFQRFHQPYKLTEFDNLLGLEFLNPHDAVELPGDLSGKRKNLRISIDLEKDEATNSPVGTTLDTKDIEVADSSLLPYGLSSLFSFYPTLASTIYPGDSAVDNGSATPVKPSEQNEHPFGVLEDEKNYSPNQQGGFQITKYVREIGIKARTLVGGFLRKEESILTPSHGQRRTRTISGEASAGLRRNSEISTLRHIIPKSSMSLYRKYRDCFENNLLLTIEKDSRFIEEEYNSLLKDMRVNVDDVRGMENLAAEGYVTAIMNCGVFQGLAQSSSAVLAYGFLFSSIVNVEAELEFFGNYVDQKASVSRDAGFASHMNELNPTMQALSSMKKTSLILSNEVQDRIVRSISRSKVAYGIEVELKKNVNNYIFQQYTYNKEISLDRLSRRISPYTPERTILEYSSQFDYDLLASDFKTVTYIASSSPGYTSFRDLTSLQQKLDHVSKDFEMRRNTQLNEAITERQDIQYIPPAQSSLDGLNGTSRSITEQLGLRLEGLIEDLKAQEDWTSFGSVGYPAFPYNSPSDEKQYESEYDGFINLAPDLYSKMANPHLQLNEIGVLRFKQALHTV